MFLIVSLVAVISAAATIVSRSPVYAAIWFALSLAGVAGVLEIAEVFTVQNPAPERSMVFLFVTLEESGLLGSKYYAAHPVIPLEKTVAVINLDAMSVIGPSKELVVIGLGNSTLDDVARYAPRDPAKVAFLTQTTLSVDDTAEIVAALKARFPAMAAPHKEDICYATTNRQEAVKRLGQGCDLVLVVGSKNSSNSVRLVEVAMRAGARDARLVDDAGQVDWSWMEGVSTLGITAGASAPERLIEELVDALRARFEAEVIEDAGERETVTFKLPRVLTA